MLLRLFGYRVSMHRFRKLPVLRLPMPMRLPDNRVNLKWSLTTICFLLTWILMMREMDAQNPSVLMVCLTILDLVLWAKELWRLTCLT